MFTVSEESTRPIVGYEKLYTVSESGMVLSLHSNKHRKPCLLKHGYKGLTLSRNGEKKHKTIHRLVAEAFLANDNNLPMVNHIDGNKTNNHVSNLEFVTLTQNVHHALRTKLMNPFGEGNHFSKLNNQQVDLIREMYKYSQETKTNVHNQAFSQNWLARCFKVQQPAINKIVTGKTWVKSPLDYTAQ